MDNDFPIRLAHLLVYFLLYTPLMLYILMNIKKLYFKIWPFTVLLGLNTVIMVFQFLQGYQPGIFCAVVCTAINVLIIAANIYIKLRNRRR